jgi:hypothetical protein
VWCTGAGCSPHLAPGGTELKAGIQRLLAILLLLSAKDSPSGFGVERIWTLPQEIPNLYPGVLAATEASEVSLTSSTCAAWPCFRATPASTR